MRYFEYMRTLVLVAIALMLGCGNREGTRPQVEDGFVGEWKSTGVGIPEDVTYNFTDKGTMTQHYPGEKDQHYSYRVETLTDFFARRSKETNVGLKEFDIPEETSANWYMITAFDPANPYEHNPARQFLYNAKEDTLQLALIAELRRVKVIRADQDLIGAWHYMAQNISPTDASLGAGRRIIQF